eukprot:830390-Pleurochrysis_carterae.AAC.1
MRRCVRVGLCGRARVSACVCAYVRVSCLRLLVHASRCDRACVCALPTQVVCPSSKIRHQSVGPDDKTLSDSQPKTRESVGSSCQVSCQLGSIPKYLLLGLKAAGHAASEAHLCLFQRSRVQRCCRSCSALARVVAAAAAEGAAFAVQLPEYQSRGTWRRGTYAQ